YEEAAVWGGRSGRSWRRHRRREELPGAEGNQRDHEGSPWRRGDVPPRQGDRRQGRRGGRQETAGPVRGPRQERPAEGGEGRLEEEDDHHRRRRQEGGRQA